MIAKKLGSALGHPSEITFCIAQNDSFTETNYHSVVIKILSLVMLCYSNRLRCHYQKLDHIERILLNL